MTYWQPRDWAKQQRIEAFRRKMASDRVTASQPVNTWMPQVTLREPIPGYNPSEWARQQYERQKAFLRTAPYQSQVVVSNTLAERYKQGAGKVSEFLTGRPADSPIPRTLGEVLGTVGQSVLMSFPPLKPAGVAVGLTGKALVAAGVADKVLNPFEWLRYGARVVGGIGRKVIEIPAQVERIGLMAQAERLAGDSGLVKEGDWSGFLKLVEDVTGKKIGTTAKAAGVKEGVPEVKPVPTGFDAGYVAFLNSFKGTKPTDFQIKRLTGAGLANWEVTDKATGVHIGAANRRALAQEVVVKALENKAKLELPAPVPGMPDYTKTLKKLTNDDWQKVIEAMGGDKPIRLPSQGGTTDLKAIATELSAHLGGPTKPPALITKTGMKQSWGERTKESTRGVLLATDRMKRIIAAVDGGDYEGKMSQTFVHPMEDSMGNRLGNVFRWQDEYSGLMKPLAVKMSRLSEVSGIKLTTGERIGIYLHSLNESNLRHMMSGNGFNDQMVNDVISSLTPAEKQVAEFYQRWAKDVQPRLAQAYKYATGKELGNVENYWPIIIEHDPKLLKQPSKIDDFTWIIERERELAKRKVWPSQSVSKGMTKRRRPKASQALDLDAEAVFLKRMLDTEHYIAMMPTIMDLQKIHGNARLRQVLAQRYGTNVWQELGDWLADAAPTRPRGVVAKLDGIPRFLREVGATGAIGLNLLSVMRQPLSVFNAMPEIGGLPALRGLSQTLTNQKGAMDTIKRLSPIARDRIQVGYVAEAKVFDTLRANMTKYGRFRAKTQEVAMLMASASDRYTTMSVWQGSFDKMVRAGFEEKIAARYADDILRRTQAMFNVLDMPSLYRRSGEMMKMLLTFTNQINQNWNYLRYDVVNLWGEKKISSPEALGKFMETVVIAGLVEAWISRSTPPDSISEAVGDVAEYGMTTIPLVGAMIPAIRYGFSGVSGITGALPESAIATIKGLTSGKTETVVKNAAEVIAYSGGLPVAQPRRSIEALIDIAQGKSKDWLSVIWGSWRREKEAKDKLRQQGITPSSGDDSFFTR